VHALDRAYVGEDVQSPVHRGQTQAHRLGTDGVVELLSGERAVRAPDSVKHGLPLARHPQTAPH